VLKILPIQPRFFAESLPLKDRDPTDYGYAPRGVSKLVVTEKHKGKVP
jgi:hypothetical protein